MNTFVIGDIHGAHSALVQCFVRSGFDPDRDRLVVLGDVVDGYLDVRACVDELLRVRDRVLILGNHDAWALEWALHGKTPAIWTSQGGDRTIASYDGGPMPPAHIDFFKSGRLWYEQDGMLFVHGGYDPRRALEDQSPETFLWDRDLLTRAWSRHQTEPGYQFGTYEAIFVGHTPTQIFSVSEPMHVCNVWDLDTGAGWSGRLTIMDAGSKKYWQSDLTPSLYNGIPGRGRGRGD